MADYMRKNEVAQILGIPKSTIRYYEQVGLIQPVIDENNYRQYGIEEIKKLTQIHFMRDLNFDIASIKTILCGEEMDTQSLLFDRKTEIKNLIQALQNQLTQIDQILAVSKQTTAHISFNIKDQPNRYLYKIQVKSGDLSELLKLNHTFFTTHHMHIGDWFINTINPDILLDSTSEVSMSFVEHIEVSNPRGISNLQSPYVCAEGGKYLTSQMKLDTENPLDWTKIVEKINNHIHSNNLKIRNGIALVTNQDNLNFNFEDEVRVLNIEIPIL